MRIGKHKDYYWLTNERQDFSIRSFLKHYPDLLINKYLAITAFDSGPVALTKEEKESGFYSLHDVVFSPTLTTELVGRLPHTGFTEWYLSPQPFDEARFVGIDLFVNYCPFFFDAESARESDYDVEFFSALADKFWAQLLLTNAEVYLADGGTFFLATTDRSVFEAIEAAGA